ncbi:hypothetical protein EYF80_043719 [Liparis tanakae]|uniref:Uncharacterized protein n=1 Tax=Liparis tanakae TaxID=230148 RepID=A0A4Z2FYY5_9TELE|nr:hypothetical protein EYF80_043719 [Liparis tanakae]
MSPLWKKPLSALWTSSSPQISMSASVSSSVHEPVAVSSADVPFSPSSGGKNTAPVTLESLLATDSLLESSDISMESLAAVEDVDGCLSRICSSRS